MGLKLVSGGHLSHGHKANKWISATSLFFESSSYEKMDYCHIREEALKFQPKILIVGGSAIPRDFDYSKMREITDEIGAYLMCDMAHYSGLVAAGVMNNPFDYVDFVTTTTHKTFPGSRGALIFYKKRIKDVNTEEMINKAIFPGLNGGPHNDTIGGIAAALKIMATPDYKSEMKDVYYNAVTLGNELKEMGYNLVTGGTDCHLLLIDLVDLSGRYVQELADYCDVNLNLNSIPGKNQIKNPSGIRLGTPAVTRRGMKGVEMKDIAKIVDAIVKLARKNSNDFESFILTANFNDEIKSIKESVHRLTSKHPLKHFNYHQCGN